MTLQAASDLPHALALGRPARGVGLRLSVTSKPANDDGVQSGVELAITGAVKSVALHLSGRGWDRRHATESPQTQLRFAGVRHGTRRTRSGQR